MKKGALAHGYVADGELLPVPEEQVAAARRLLERRLPLNDRHEIAQMLGVAA